VIVLGQLDLIQLQHEEVRPVSGVDQSADDEVEDPRDARPDRLGCEVDENGDEGLDDGDADVPN
jgi:hypothetical protein